MIAKMLMMMMIAATSPHHQLLVDRVSEGGRQQGGGEQGEHQEQTNLQVIFCFRFIFRLWAAARMVEPSEARLASTKSKPTWS